MQTSNLAFEVKLPKRLPFILNSARLLETLVFVYVVHSAIGLKVNGVAATSVPERVGSLLKRV